MKQVNNRQNKSQIKPQIRSVTHRPVAFDQPLEESQQPAFGPRGTVVGLVSNLLLATKIAQAAKNFGVSIHNSDRAESLLQFVQQKKIYFIILDWDGCEAEAFKFLNAKRQMADLKGVPVIGYLSQAKHMIKEEAQKAGCDRVYGKTEFQNVLNDLMMRYVQ